MNFNTESLESQMNDMVDSAKKLVPKIAKVTRLYYLSLIEEGFTKKEALELCKNYKVN
jgi:hypothetical protein